MKSNNKKLSFFIAGVFFLITLIFFYPLFKGFVPFPGDLLIGEYNPYSSYSYFGFNPGSYPNKGQDFDVIRLIYPAKEFSIQELKQGRMPLWNPYNFSGNPHLASLQSGTFYPLNIIFFMLPFILAWTVYIFCQPLLAGFFTYLLLKQYKISTQSAIFAGVVFGFSSFMSVWLEYGNLGHSFLWLPLVLYLITKQFGRSQLGRAILISLVLSLSILAGYIQMSMYVFLFSFAYVLFHYIFIDSKNRIKNIVHFVWIFLLPVLICAIQLFPTIALFSSSSRNAYALQEIFSRLIPIFHIVTMFVPDFFGNPATRNYWLNGTYIERVSYVGVVPLLFIVYLFSQKVTRLVWFYGVSAIVVFLLVFNTPLGRGLYTLYLPPIISTGVPSRMMFLFCFAFSVLSGFGMDLFLRQRSIKKLSIISIIFILIFSGFWVFSFFGLSAFSHFVTAENLAITKRNLLIPTAFLLLGLFGMWASTLFQNKKRNILYGLILVTVLELFLFFHKITPFAPLESVYPKTEIMQYLRSIQGIDRSWGYGSAYIDTNIQTYEHIFGTNGYDALHLKRYGEFVSASKNGKMMLPPPRSEAEIAGGYGESDLQMNVSRQKIMNILGVKYVLHKTTEKSPDSKTFPSDTYALFGQKGEWQIYENKKAIPRVYTVSKVIIESNPEKIMEKLLGSDFDPRHEVILESKMQDQHLQFDPNSQVVMLSYKPTMISLRTSTKTDSVLVISDNYAPGWKAFIDKKEVKILRANYTFRAVFLKKGKHTVIFSYQPFSFGLGAIASVLTLLSLLACVLYLHRTKRKNEAV